jgi:hypothetical protein
MTSRLMFILLCAMQYANGTEQKQLHVYAIPGQNGLGSEVPYVQNLLGSASITITPVPTPTYIIDLGQNRCIHYLRKSIREGNANHTSIIHATSQGTATALNYVASEDKGKNIKALILEAAFGSGNSAIHHTVDKLMHVPWLVNLPFSYYWLPYTAKYVFPFYWPFGKQAITSIKNIPADMPVVIAHSKNDRQLSYDDACALYYGLRIQGNDNVYLITKNGNKHLNILRSEDDKRVVCAILEKHGLFERCSNPDDSIDLCLYQPDYVQFKNQYDVLIGREKNHVRLGYALGAVTFAAISHLLSKSEMQLDPGLLLNA